MGLNIIYERRSVRKFRNEQVSDDQVVKILKAAMAAPSAGNQQPWHFVVVRKEDVKEKLSEVHPYVKMVKSAPVAILVCGDPSLEKFPGYWTQDCSAATQNILLAVQALGLGAVWTGVYPDGERVQKIREILEVPDGVMPFSLIPIGYPGESKEHPDRINLERVHEECW